MHRRLPLLVTAIFLVAFASIALAEPIIELPVAYVPVVAGGTGPTWTPAPTVTPSLTPTPVLVLLLLNGDFESGEDFWSPTGIITSTLPSPVMPFSGTHVAQLIASHPGIPVKLDTTATVPSIAPYLSYWIWIRSTDPTCGNDRGSIRINGVEVDGFDLCTTTQTSGWVRRTVNLATHSGQMVTISLVAKTSDNDAPDSALYVDDIGWRHNP